MCIYKLTESSTYKDDNGKEGEGNGSLGSAPVLLEKGHRPLVGQEAEAYEPEERPDPYRTYQRSLPVYNSVEI